MLSHMWLIETRWTWTRLGTGCRSITDMWAVLGSILTSLSSLLSTSAGAPELVVSFSAS